jgi:hypothetical protein
MQKFLMKVWRNMGFRTCNDVTMLMMPFNDPSLFDTVIENRNITLYSFLYTAVNNAGD